MGVHLIPMDRLSFPRQREDSHRRGATWKPVSVPEFLRDDAADLEQTSPETEAFSELWVDTPASYQHTWVGAWRCAGHAEQQALGWESTLPSDTIALCDFGRTPSLRWASVFPSVK